jgi:hypothetical protein
VFVTHLWLNRMYVCMSSDQISDVKCGACGMYKRKVKRRGFWWNSLTGSDHLEALGIDEMILLKLILTGSK